MKEVPGTEAEAAPTVRPYAVTRGRRAPTAAELPLEALVRATSAPRPGATGEECTALELTSAAWLSVAELSAHLRLPVPVVRVVVDALVREGSLRVQATPSGHQAASRDLLLNVLDGIRAL